MAPFEQILLHKLTKQTRLTSFGGHPNTCAWVHSHNPIAMESNCCFNDEVKPVLQNDSSIFRLSMGADSNYGCCTCPFFPPRLTATEAIKATAIQRFNFDCISNYSRSRYRDTCNQPVIYKSRECMHGEAINIS